MRIVNTRPTPSYVEEAGKLLNPGEASKELALSVLFTTQTLAKMDRGTVLIRLAEAEVSLLQRILANAKAPVTLAQVPQPPPQATRVAAVKEETAKRRQAKKTAVAKGAPIPVVLPQCTTGQPAYAQVGATVIDGKPMSLDQLKNHNAAVAAKKRAALADAASLMRSRI